MTTRTFEVLLKDPNAMGRPFMHSWVTVTAPNRKAAKVDAESGRYGFHGWRATRVVPHRDPQ